VAATNRDLAARVAQGLFREDLFYRLSTITLHLPPLRARPDDVPILAEHFVAILNQRFGCRKRLAGDAMARLTAHTWPGNVRELQHVIEAAVVVSDGPEIHAAHLPPLAGHAAGTSGTDGSPGQVPTLAEAERALIERALAKTGGRRAEAARLLGISERNLYRKLREYALSS
jgi:DNA-binding NtrC family response regulator